MALGRHVDPEKLIAESLDHPVHKHMGKRYVLLLSKEVS
jgi:glutamate decarboxylase